MDKIQTYVNGDKPRIEVEEVAPGQIDKILAERGSRYGKFDKHAEITQDLKRVMSLFSNAPGVGVGDTSEVRPWDTKLDDDQREALEMIAHKIGRILNGDPDYEDSWRDIAGYATLVADRLIGKPR